MIAGDFCIIKGSGWASDLVEAIEHSSWTHVESATDETHYLNPVFPYIVEDAGIFKADATHFVVSPDITPGDRISVARNLRANIGRHYGLVAFVWAGLTVLIPPLRRMHDPIKDAGKVCSTTLAYAYYNAGCYDKLKVADYDPGAVSPALLAERWGAA